MSNFSVSLFAANLFISTMIASCGPDLSETGIPTEATVISKRELDLKKNKYYITVNFFTQPDEENPKPPKPKSDSPRSADDIINSLTIDVNIGDYTTAEVEVSSAEYDLYQEGDEINIKYEKGNPTHIVIVK